MKTTIQMPRRWLVTTIVAGTIAALAGIGFQIFKNQQPTTEVARVAEPEAESEPTTPTPVCDVSAVQNQIQQFVGLQAANGIEYAVGYYNLATECGFYHNAQQEWLGASTTKVVLALMVYEQVATGQMQLDQLIRYQASTDYEAGAGSLQYQANLQDVSVQTLIEVMILESDNIAKNMLLRVLGGREAMHAYLQRITGETVVDRTSNQVTAQQLTQVLKHLVNVSTPGSTEIQTLMAQTSDQTRIAASVNPDGSQPIIVHKIGDFNADGMHYLHDIAIVRTPQPYILVVMTKSEPTSDAFVYEQITTLANQLNALQQ